MGMPIVYHPGYVTPLPAGHRFPMGKFAMLYRYLRTQGVVRERQVHRPTAPPRCLIERAHDRDYVNAYLEGRLPPAAMRRIGLPWSPGLARRTALAVAGSVLTMRLALRHGLACNTAGGTHHAHRDFGAGYCIFNDLAVAARTALDEGLARRVMVIDLDVHQGDGTAAILADEPAVTTISMHGERNFPLRKAASTVDIPLPDGMADQAYLDRLREALPGWLATARPDLVLYDAGVDPHQHDRLGRLGLTDLGLAQRDRMVLETCLDAGAAVACVIGGGYADHLPTLAARHAILHQVATDVYQNRLA